jgi:hypothetical protein
VRDIFDIHDVSGVGFTHKTSCTSNISLTVDDVKHNFDAFNSLLDVTLLIPITIRISPLSPHAILYS